LQENESYNAVTGRLVTWVKIPSLPAATNTIIYMYSSNRGAVPNPSTNATWNANYVGVCHLSSNPSTGGASVVDTTSNVLNGTPTSMEAGDRIAGRVNTAFQFDGTNEHITVPDNVKLEPASITLSCWYNFNNGIPDWYAKMVNKGKAMSPYGSYSIETRDPQNSSGFQTARTDGNYNATEGDASSLYNTYYYIVGTYNNTTKTQKCFVNGTLISINTSNFFNVYN
jgi:hypothetical protein